MVNYGPYEIFDLNTSFERSLSKLSENHKNVDIGSTILKLWLLKDVMFDSSQGLGKTLQCIALMWTLLRQGPNCKLPHPHTHPHPTPTHTHTHTPHTLKVLLLLTKLWW